MPGSDLDNDGDFDGFDQTLQIYLDNPGLALGELQEIRTDLALQNAIHEVAEDFGEMFDGNPNNDSFFDGGNGSGNETPTDWSLWPPGSDPVNESFTFNFGGQSWTYWQGANFTYVGDGGPGGGGGGILDP